jgi:hypothetical protein
LPSTVLTRSKEGKTINNRAPSYHQRLEKKRRLHRKRERKRQRRVRQLRSTRRVEQDFLFQFKLAIQTFFPNFDAWLARIDDPRQKSKVKYGIRTMMWVGLLILGTPTTSMNEYNDDFFTQETVLSLRYVFGIKHKRPPDRGTLANLWKKLSVEELEKLRRAMLQALIRSRRLEKFLYLGFYRLAIDGVECFRFDHKHCDACLHATKDGKTEYYHRVLEAKLVFNNSLAISLGSEFIDNDKDKKDDKQDSELKAFYRLQERIKKEYPKLPIILLMDAMFAVGPVFSICRKHGWKFVITFKEKDLPSVWQEFQDISKIDPNTYAETLTVGKKVKIVDEDWQYQWVNHISYQGKHFLGSVHVVLAWRWVNDQKQGDKPPLKYGFITDFEISKENVQEIITLGRKRWKIENQGFNVQKNSVYQLEHPYCQDYNAMKVVYLLIQIAHFLNQLVLLTDLLKAKARHQIETAESFLAKLKYAICGMLWTDEVVSFWHRLQCGRYQARWVWDP